MVGEDVSLVAHRFYTRFGSGDLDGAVALVASGYVGHGLGAGGGPESVRQDLDTWCSAVPDVSVEIHDTISQGDRVVVRMTLRGTQSGDFGSVPASGRSFEIGGTDILRVDNGQIVEAWTLCDLASMFIQIGALPAG